MQAMKSKDVESLLNHLGFYWRGANGGHQLFYHPEGARPVTVTHNSKNREFGPNLIKKILKDARESLTTGAALRAKRGENLSAAS